MTRRRNQTDADGALRHFGSVCMFYFLIRDALVRVMISIACVSRESREPGKTDMLSRLQQILEVQWESSCDHYPRSG